MQRESPGRAGRALASLLSGVEEHELEENVEAAGVLVAELFSLARHYLTQGKRK